MVRSSPILVVYCETMMAPHPTLGTVRARDFNSKWLLIRARILAAAFLLNVLYISK